MQTLCFYVKRIFKLFDRDYFYVAPHSHNASVVAEVVWKSTGELELKLTEEFSV